MLAPKTFTIGDSWYITVTHVTSGRTGLLIPDAIVIAHIVDKLTREIIFQPTQLVLIDAATATYQTIVPETVQAINNEQYVVNTIVTHGGVSSTVSYDLTAIRDNIHSPRLNFAVAAQFTIGDDLPFRALNVRDAFGNVHNGQVKYELLDKLTRQVLAYGDMTLYDPANGSYEAVIDKALTNVQVNNDYVLHAIILTAIKTTASANLCATRDSITVQ